MRQPLLMLLLTVIVAAGLLWLAYEPVVTALHNLEAAL